MVDLAQVVDQRGLLRAVLESLRSDPLHVSDDVARDAELRELQVQRVARRAGFVEGPESLAAELLDEPPNPSWLVGDDTERLELAVPAFVRIRGGNRVGVYVEAEKSSSLLHDRFPSQVALRHGLAIEA